MKANRKGGGIKALLLNHCEKAGVFVFALLAGWLVYASLGVEGETRAPNELNNAVQATRTAFAESRWTDVPEEERRDAASVAAQEAVEISSEIYPNARGLDVAVVPPTVDRVDPSLLPATELEVNAVTGLMAFIDDDIRKKRELQRIREEEEKRREREKAREDNALDSFTGGGGRGRGGGFGGFGGEQEGDGKRRPVPTRVRDGGFIPQGDERIEAVSTAVVLAKAPLYDQYKIYKDALEIARDYDPMRDIPRYLGCFVERAEVSDGDELQWQPVPVVGITGGKKHKAVLESSLMKVMEDWAGGQMPLVDARFEHPALTMQLPPLVGVPWGTEVVHTEAPLQSETDAKMAEEQREGLEEDEEPAEGDEDEEGTFLPGLDGPLDQGDFRDGRRGAGGRGFSGGRGMGRGMGGEMGFGGEMGMGRGMGGEMGFGGEMGMGRGMGGAMRGGRAPRGGAEVQPSEDVPFMMVRFFDHTVQPGKRYRYRIQLIVADVNHGVDPRALAREVVDRREPLTGTKRRVRLAEWSEPSPVVTIPQSGDIYLASVKPPSARQVGAEGRATFVMQRYALDEKQFAIQAALEEVFQRGAVINVTKDAEFITPDRRWIEKYDSFAFHSGVTLVDYDGGQAITRDIAEPGRVLLMDSGGRLYIRHEMDDAEPVANYEAVFKDKGDDRGGMGRGMEFMRGGEF